jgi:hypothetical protein
MRYMPRKRGKNLSETTVIAMSEGAIQFPSLGASQRRSFIGGSDARIIMG